MQSQSLRFLSGKFDCWMIRVCLFDEPFYNMFTMSHREKMSYTLSLLGIASFSRLQSGFFSQSEMPGTQTA